MPIRFPEDEPTLAHFRKAEEGGGEESALLVRHSGLPQMHMHMHTYIYAYIYIDPRPKTLWHSHGVSGLQGQNVIANTVRR